MYFHKIMHILLTTSGNKHVRTELVVNKLVLKIKILQQVIAISMIFFTPTSYSSKGIKLHHNRSTIEAVYMNIQMLNIQMLLKSNLEPTR